jgi:putative ABC transport system ATP-binding protein
MGPSGSGKTTLLNLLCGWEQPDAGTISWQGRPADPLERPWSDLALIPQSFGLLEELTATENIAWPARLASRPAPGLPDLLDALDLGPLTDRFPAQMSLGECQRVSVARALLLHPKLLLADEPTAHQDAVRAGAILALLRAFADEGGTCVISTHDAELISRADRALTMTDGRPQES